MIVNEKGKEVTVLEYVENLINSIPRYSKLLKNGIKFYFIQYQ